jgi:hypothetical protein
LKQWAYLKHNDINITHLSDTNNFFIILLNNVCMPSEKDDSVGGNEDVGNMDL